MALEFHPLPLDLFDEQQRPVLARLNSELRDIFALEGTLRQPLTVRRSDLSIARRGEEQVHITRITPDIATVVSGASTVVGTPALTFGLLNTIGTTTSTVSVNSAIRLYDTELPEGISDSAATGSSPFASRRDHIHNHPSIPGDVHTVYILASGTRAFTGNQSIGGFNLTSIGDLFGASAATLDLTSLQSNGASNEAFRFMADTNAEPNNSFEYFSIGFDNAGYQERIRFVADGLVGAGGPGIELNEGSGTFRGTIGYATTVGRLHTGFLFGPDLIRFRVGDGNVYDVSTAGWNVLTGGPDTLGFENRATVPGQAAPAFRFTTTSSNIKTAGEFVAFENPLNTNQWEVDFEGNVTQQGNLIFPSGTETVAGIQNQNLVDKSAAETITGVWGHDNTLNIGSGSQIDFTADNIVSTTNAMIGKTAASLLFNTLTGDTFEWKINSVTEYDFSATQADFNGNNLVSVGIVNADTGYQIGGAAADNNILRGNGTNFVSEVEVLSKSIVVESPTSSEDITIFFTPVAITVTQVRVLLANGSATPTVTFQVFHNTDRSAAGNAGTTSQAVTNTTTGIDATLGADTTVPADSWVWFETTAQGGTTPEIAFTIRFTID